MAYSPPSDAVAGLHADARRYTRLGWLIVLAGVGGFLLWALFAPLDKGVPVNGTLIAAGNRKAVQHPTGGIIDDILVKDGDRVKAGQTLIKMNSVQTGSLADTTRSQYLAALAAQARLTAERDNASHIAFPPPLDNAGNEPRVAALIATQTQLLASRQSALRSEIAGIDENIAGLKAQLRGLQDMTANLKEQQQLMREQLDNMRDLAKDGYVARNRLLDLERAYTQIAGAMAENSGNLGRIQSQIAELGVRKVQRQQEYQKEVRGQLADAQREADGLSGRLSGQEFDLANAVVKAPVDGTVVGLAVFTRGGVVQPGFKMMDIVPNDDALVVEAQVPVHLIDRVHNGLPVELMFSAFNQNRTPHVAGVVTDVAADRAVDEKTGTPYYKIRAQAAPEGRAEVARLAVRPGMPVEVFIKTGERTMMSYLLKPVIDRARTALSEE